MDKKYYQTKEFLTLEKEWKDKLKESGFKDIENGQNQLKQRASNVYRQADEITREAKIHYFELLVAHVELNKFDNEIDKLVMTLKSQGKKIKEICEQLEKKGKKRYRRTVRLIIRRYETKWKIKLWPKEKLTYNWRPKK